jgi:nitrate reductase NapAB chaperone NapD
MPVFSFLAYPKANMKEQLIQDLSRMSYCDVQSAENEDVLILLTDTPDEESSTDLINTVKELESLQSLNMTFGHTEL